ncbi:MAG TPA: arginase family protein [Actinomycetota bacterium]|jgi:arginase|nr:arginase family protein [Actinomycetota bacterium]
MRPFTFLGVPIDSVGRSGGTEHAPAAFRGHSHEADPWSAADAGDLDVRIRGDVRDPASGVIAIDDVVAMTREIGDAVEGLRRDGRIPFVMGGCCSLIPGALAGARRVDPGVGLVYLDGHLDLYDGETSPTGEAADMPIAVVLGRGPSVWVDAAGSVADPDRVWLLGPRDLEEALGYGHPHPDDIAGLTFTDADTIRALGPGAVGRATADAAGPCWVHLDVDVLDEAAFPATDYLMPGGLQLAELGDLLRPLLASPSLAGISIGCYNPDKDPGGANGDALTGLFRDALAG